MDLFEAFVNLDRLNEQDFDTDKEGIEELSDFMADDNTEDAIEIIDPNIEEDGDIADSYVGKIVIQCDTCNSLIYKDADEIIWDDASDLVNVDEECPVCKAMNGFIVIGQIQEYQKDEEEDIEDEDEIEVKDEDEVDTIEKDDEEVEVKEESFKRPRRAKKLPESFIKARNVKRPIKESVNRSKYVNSTSRKHKDVSRKRKGAVISESINKRHYIGKPLAESKVNKRPSKLRERLSQYDPQRWSDEDIALHKSIDWTARNYEDYPVENDYIMSKAYLYGVDGNKVVDNIKFVKKLRANPIYPPYYGTEDFQPFKGYTNGMYDGHKHGIYDIHDRFEDWETNRMMSEDVKVDKKSPVANALASHMGEFGNIADVDALKKSIKSVLKSSELSAKDQTSALHKLLAPKTTAEVMDVLNSYIVSSKDENYEHFNEKSFDKLSESYFKEVYENVDKFKTSAVSRKDNKLFIEGVLTFKSGKEKKTSFVFESFSGKNSKVRLIGENKQISPVRNSFRVSGHVKNGEFICESFRYNYSEGKNKITGVCK